MTNKLKDGFQIMDGHCYYEGVSAAAKAEAAHPGSIDWTTAENVHENDDPEKPRVISGGQYLCRAKVRATQPPRAKTHEPKDEPKTHEPKHEPKPEK